LNISDRSAQKREIAGANQTFSPTTSDRQVWDILMSVYQFPALCVADAIGLFEGLKDNSYSIEEIAIQFSMEVRGAEALVGILSSLGLLDMHSGQICLTDIARNFLLADSPFYWGGSLRLLRDFPFNYSSMYDALMNHHGPRAVESRSHELSVGGEPSGGSHGRTANSIAVRGAFAGVKRTLEQYTAAMHSQASAAATGVAVHGNFSKIKRLLDVGGGSGRFSISLALRYPSIHCTIFELMTTAKVTRAFIDQNGLGDRVTVVVGDMFRNPWPPEIDAVFLSNILHDWSKDRCELLLANAFASLPPSGRIFVHEMLLDDSRVGPLAASCFSMNMVFFSKGKQFSFEELRVLLENTGFREITVINSSGYFSLVSAGKP